MDGAATRRARGRGGALARVLLACVALSGCGKSAQTADGGATTGASVIGRLYLPGTVPGVSYFVRLATSVSTVTTPVVETKGTTPNINFIDYELHNVPAGSYFMLTFVDVDGSGGTASTPGDFAGWCNVDTNGNPPAAANVFVPDTGTVRYDCSLVIR